jgi:protein TonB
MLAGKLVAPTVIPKEIAQVLEAPELAPGLGVVGGVPGGIPGGQIGGVIGGVIGGIPTAVPKPVVAPQPIRVGGRVTAPRLIRRVEPVYPALARQARIEGSIRIDAVIDETGHVVEMKVLSGHPILVKAALDAVQQWVYEPTLLNDQAVPVLLEVTVNFVLAGLR